MKFGRLEPLAVLKSELATLDAISPTLLEGRDFVTMVPIEEAAVKEEEAPFSFVMLERVSGYVVDPVARGFVEEDVC